MTELIDLLKSNGFTVVEGMEAVKKAIRDAAEKNLSV